MLIQHQAEVGKGSRKPTEPQHIPSTALPSHIVPILTVASSSQPKKTQKHKKTKRKATEISQSSGPTTLVADETVYEERGDKVERAATTTASLDAEQDSGIIIAPNPQQYLMSLFLRELVQVVVLGFRNYSSKEESQEDTEIQGKYGHDIEINTASTSITTANINITIAEPVTTVNTPITTTGVFVSTAEPSTVSMGVSVRECRVREVKFKREKELG
nr:hypothetical protein [Tanacetum cinerariifolium]